MICRVLSTTPLDIKKVPLFLLLQSTWSLVFHYLLTDLSFRFSWYYNHQVLDSQDYSLSVVSPDAFTSSLSFSNLTTRHSGNYTCEARNAASFHMHSAHLIVNGNDFFWILNVRGSKGLCSILLLSLSFGFFLFQCRQNGYLLQKILMSDLAVLVMWNVRRLVFLNPKYHGSVWWRIPPTHIRANSLKCQRKAHISSKVIIFSNVYTRSNRNSRKYVNAVKFNFKMADAWCLFDNFFGGLLEPSLPLYVCR